MKSAITASLQILKTECFAWCVKSL